ncbi:hypothetical protein PILCRDRAFT_825094 [Piloderma croceum F 1598]|uniref:Uncharacterized protein n=1 Tax=Piloderma croceum (strain F 1598) TaxID=765440 RepID=A0A0C3AV64_PILCF|nr:hypothetical protein PILCRDRAFT_825094 [Piloderma croceum F 1598]
MVYRTFVVWSYNVYVIVIPCLTFVATLTSGVSFVKIQHQTKNVETSVFTKSVTQWTVAFLLCSFATTVYSTGLIAYKLLKSQMNLRRHGLATGGGLSNRMMRIVVESAAIYSLNHFIYAVLYEVKNQVESTPSFLEASLASITCSLIIVRSESTQSQPLSTTIGSGPMKALPEPLAFGKHSENQHGGNHVV